MLKFDRQAVIQYLYGRLGAVSLTVSGQLGDGSTFEGNDTIRVINPGGQRSISPMEGEPQEAN